MFNIALLRDDYTKNFKREKRTFRANWNQLDALARDIIESLIHVGDFMEPHLASVGSRKGLSWDHLEQQHQFQPIPEIVFDRFDGSACFA